MDHLVWQRGSGELQVRRNQLPDPEGPVDVDGLLAAAVDVSSPVAERAEEPGQAKDVVAVQVRDEDLADPARLYPAPLQLDLGSLAAVEEPHAAVVVLQRQAGDAPRRRREAGRRPEEHYAHPWRGKEIGAVFIENDCGLL